MGRQAIVTSLAAFVLLGAPAAFAQTAPQTARQSAPSLQALVNDTAVQFQLAYRHDAAEHRRRYDELAKAVSAWRAAPRDAANNQRLADWLRAAMRTSMPGSHDPLPPVPQFELAAAVEPLENPTTVKLPIDSPESPVGSDDFQFDGVLQSGPNAESGDMGDAKSAPPDEVDLEKVESPGAEPISIEAEAEHTQSRPLERMSQPQTYGPNAMDKSTGDPFVDDPL
jgi:hypothetical protein